MALKLIETNLEKGSEIVNRMATSGEFVKSVGDSPVDQVLKTFENQPDFHLFLLKDDDEIVGMTSTFPNKKPGRISIGYTFINPQYRGRGFGYQIRKMLIDWIRAQGFNEVYAKTWTGNEPMISLNKKMGFELIETEENTRVDGQGTLKYLLKL